MDQPRAHMHNLPLELSRLIGREWELAEIASRLSTNRLVTLSGPGGCGKTRLAYRVAADLLDQSPDGSWLIDLSVISDACLIPGVVTTALGLHTDPSIPQSEMFQGLLRHKELLLVLDNCEHLVADCARFVDELLRKCPHVRILATSREPLGVEGEMVYRVPCLTTPDPNQLPPLDQFLEYEAVRLFTDRAAAACSTFQITAEWAPIVAQICHRLDAIPLAIELAAARLNGLSLHQISDRLQNRFELLTGGRRTAPYRQKTLRANVDWSHDLLSAQEQILWRRLSLFGGSFSLNALETVCAGEEITRAEVVPLLLALIEKSMVLVASTPRENRYRLLETHRQYGAEKLRAAGEERLLAERHSIWYLLWAEQLLGLNQADILDRLEQEHDNLRAALQRIGTAEEAELGLRICCALAFFWEVRGYLPEGRTHLSHVLNLATARTSTYAEALRWAGQFARQTPAAPEGVCRRDAICADSLAELTSREWDIVWLVAEGLKDNAIAQQLYLSRHTVANNLRRICSKLGLSTRTQLAVWAVRNSYAADQAVGATVRGGSGRNRL
jgi:predicted ATPase/DNA-binding CsgD family transcriptional regulator